MEETISTEILKANEKIVQLAITKKELSDELNRTQNELEEEIARFAKIVKRVDDLLSIPQP